MKYSEFKRYLIGAGAIFREGGKHTKVYLNGKQSVLPRHMGEIPLGTMKAICNQLGIDPP
jgi:mRNA interferase HicA